MQHKIIRAITVVTAAFLLTTISSVRAQADTIGFSFSNFAGTGTAPPVQNGTTLIVDNAATGSFLTDSPTLNLEWNPVTFTDHCMIDLTTGFLTGTVNFVFADGATLFGTEAEDVRALVVNNGVGPLTGTFTFTGGTSQFAGATGSISFSGIATDTGFIESGSGILTAAGITTPEPASAVLIFAGLGILIFSKWRASAVV